MRAWTRRGLLSAAALIVTAIAAGCSSRTDSPARSVDLTMRDVAFEPAALRLRAEQPARLVFRNQGAVLHDFRVEAMPVRAVKARTEGAEVAHGHDATPSAIHIALRAGGAGTIDLTPAGKGRYEYYCSEPGHRDAGMHGVIEVE